MDELILKIFAQAGPLVMLAGLFLYFDWRCENRRTETIDKLADSIRALADRLASRPCLWEAARFENLVERVSEAVSLKMHGRTRNREAV